MFPAPHTTGMCRAGLGSRGPKLVTREESLHREPGQQSSGGFSEETQRARRACHGLTPTCLSGQQVTRPPGLTSVAWDTCSPGSLSWQSDTSGLEAPLLLGGGSLGFLAVVPASRWPRCPRGGHEHGHPGALGGGPTCLASVCTHRPSYRGIPADSVLRVAPLLGLSTWAWLGAPRKVPTAGFSCGLGQAGPAATLGRQRAERGGPRRRGNRHKNNYLQCAAHGQACSLGTSEPPEAPCPVGVPGVVSPGPVLCFSPVTAGLGLELSPHTCLISPSQEDPPSWPGTSCLRRKRVTSLNRSLRPKAAVAQGGGVYGGCGVRGLRRCGGRREGEGGGQRTPPSCAHQGLSLQLTCGSPSRPLGLQDHEAQQPPTPGPEPQGPGEALRACGSEMGPGPARKSFPRGLLGTGQVPLGLPAPLPAWSGVSLGPRRSQRSREVVGERKRCRAWDEASGGHLVQG